MRQHLGIAAGVQHGIGAGRIAGVAEHHQPNAVASIPGERPAGGGGVGILLHLGLLSKGNIQPNPSKSSADGGADADADGGDAKTDDGDDDKLVHDDVSPRRQPSGRADGCVPNRRYRYPDPWDCNAG